MVIIICTIMHLIPLKMQRHVKWKIMQGLFIGWFGQGDTRRSNVAKLFITVQIMIDV